MKYSFLGFGLIMMGIFGLVFIVLGYKKGFIKNAEENSNRKYRTKIILTDEGRQINRDLNAAINLANYSK